MPAVPQQNGLEGKRPSGHGGAAPQAAPFLRHYGKCRPKSSAVRMPAVMRPPSGILQSAAPRSPEVSPLPHRTQNTLSRIPDFPKASLGARVLPKPRLPLKRMAADPPASVLPASTFAGPRAILAGCPRRPRTFFPSSDREVYHGRPAMHPHPPFLPFL